MNKPIADHLQTEFRNTPLRLFTLAIFNGLPLPIQELLKKIIRQATDGIVFAMNI